MQIARCIQMRVFFSLSWTLGVTSHAKRFVKQRIVYMTHTWRSENSFYLSMPIEYEIDIDRKCLYYVCMHVLYRVSRSGVRHTVLHS